MVAWKIEFKKDGQWQPLGSFATPEETPGYIDDWFLPHNPHVSAPRVVVADCEGTVRRNGKMLCLIP